MDLQCEAWEAYEDWSRGGGIGELDLRDAFIAGYVKKAEHDRGEETNGA